MYLFRKKETNMSARRLPESNNSPAHRSTAANPSRSRAGPYDAGGPNIQKIIGAALMIIGALYACYNAAEGFSWLLNLVFDHFGLIALSATINFVFWTIIVFPIGGFIANGICGFVAV
jgi:hypothetical protein